MAAGLLIAVFACAWPATAQAQQPQPPGRGRPFQGLFGAPQDPDRAQTLSLTASLYGGYDDNVIAGQGAIGPDPRAQVGSGLIGGSTTLAYTKNARRTSFSATANADTRYYPERSTLSASSYGFGAGLTHQLSRRTRVSFSEGLSYQPFYQLGVFPGLGDPSLGGGVPSNLDLAVERRASWVNSASVRLDRELSQRSSLEFTYANSQQRFTEDAIDVDGNPIEGGNLSYNTVGFRFRRAITQYLSARIGYDYRRGSYAGSANNLTEGHNIDVGLDYARSLAFSRRTTFSFSTGSVIVQQTNQPRSFRVTGNATLLHELNRDWTASVTYLRDLGFFGNFGTPLFSDSVSAGLRGILADRVLMTARVGYLSGELGLQGTSGDIRTWTGSLSAMYALTQLLGLDVTYSYFQYEFGADALRPPGLQPNFDRNSIRAGLTLWLPIIR